MTADLSGALLLDRATLVECEPGHEGLPQKFQQIFYVGITDPY